jgi:hypothetical protein
MRLRPQPQTEQTPSDAKDYGLQRLESMTRIAQFQRKSGNGPICLAIFLAISILAQQNFSLIPSLPDEIRHILGRPPSPKMISAALVLYSFSAIILILSRMVTGSLQYGGIAHVGYLTAFYIFFHFSQSMDENFWAVFAAGMTVLMLESYYIWTRCNEEIRKEREFLSQLDRKEKAGFLS